MQPGDDQGLLCRQVCRVWNSWRRSWLQVQQVNSRILECPWRSPLHMTASSPQRDSLRYADRNLSCQSGRQLLVLALSEGERCLLAAYSRSVCLAFGISSYRVWYGAVTARRTRQLVRLTCRDLDNLVMVHRCSMRWHKRSIFRAENKRTPLLKGGGNSTERTSVKKLPGTYEGLHAMIRDRRTVLQMQHENGSGERLCQAWKDKGCP